MNLIRAALRPQPKQRPTMAAIMAHPFWWSPARKLAFLIDVSNRVENEDREVSPCLPNTTLFLPFSLLQRDQHLQCRGLMRLPFQ